MDKNYYAVKKMTRRFQGEGKYYTQGEMKAMALIQNTDDNVNIVRYFQSWVEGGKSYLVVKNSNFISFNFKDGILSFHSLQPSQGNRSPQ